MKSSFICYVYEHWRPDKDLPFYVGEGSGKRANDLHNRSRYHKNMQKRLARLGMCVEVRLVAEGLDKRTARDMEIERIAFWKAAGVRLANRDDGGGGGRKWDEKTRQKAKASWTPQKRAAQAERARQQKLGEKSPPVSKEERKRRGKVGWLKRAAAGIRISDETRQKLSEAGKRRFSRAGEREKAAEAFKGAWARRKAADPDAGRWSPETRQRMTALATGKKQSAETIAKRLAGSRATYLNDPECHIRRSEGVRRGWSPERREAASVRMIVRHAVNRQYKMQESK